jgi:hypothetical protein
MTVGFPSFRCGARWPEERTIDVHLDRHSRVEGASRLEFRVLGPIEAIRAGLRLSPVAKTIGTNGPERGAESSRAAQLSAAADEAVDDDEARDRSQVCLGAGPYRAPIRDNGGSG